MYADEEIIPLPDNGLLETTTSVLPLALNESGVWYLIDGTTWTSEVGSDNIIEIDEYVDIGDVNLVVPNHFTTLAEHYFSFGNLLQITDTKEMIMIYFCICLRRMNAKYFSNL